jgi:hypothetical protein
MTKQELLDEGYGLWYIVLEHTNHRFRNFVDELFIYDDIDAAKTKATSVSNREQKYLPMMVKDYNLKWKKHMPSTSKKYTTINKVRGTKP